MMVEMVEPKPTDRIGDLAAGTCGFPVNAYYLFLINAIFNSNFQFSPFLPSCPSLLFLRFLRPFVVH